MSNAVYDELIKTIGEEQYNDSGYALSTQTFKDDSSINYREYILRPEGVGVIAERFKADNDTLEFNYIPKGDTYIPNKIKFQMEGSFSAGAGATLVNEYNIAASLALLFKRGTHRIGSSQSEEIPCIGMGDYILKLNDYSVDFANTTGSLMGFYPNLDVADATAGTAVDVNSKRRQARFCRTGTTSGAPCKFSVTFTLPFALFNCDKYLTNVGWTLTLQRNGDKYIFEKSNAGTTQVPVLTINKLHMIIPVITPNLKVKMLYDEQAKKLFTLQTKRVYVINKNVGLLSGAGSYNETVANLPARPSKVYIAFQNPNREANLIAGANEHVSPSFFDHCNIKTIRLVINNSESIPELVPENDFEATDKTYSHQLAQLYECSGAMNNTEAGSIINYENFGTMYPIFGFKLNRNPKDVPELSSTACKIDLQVNCTSTPTFNPNMFMVCVFDTVISILGDSSVSKTLIG